MKSFSNFLQEAKSSKASIQARRLGLTGDGHGGWYDNNGEFTAKTVGGKLKFYNQNQVVGRQDPQQDRTPSNQQPVSTQVATPKKIKNSITIAFGRFNPPTLSTEEFLNDLSEIANDGEYRIYPSRSTDSKKDPLDPDTKIDIMVNLFPEHQEAIVNDENMNTIFDVLQSLNEEGYEEVIIVSSSDRQSEFENLATKYNGQLYNFSNIEVIGVGEEDPDLDSKIRKSVVENDFETFKLGVPESLNDKQKKEYFNILKKSINVKENYELWEIAPRLDFHNLRDNYVKGSIFNIGDIVENMNNGLVGKIIRRGANYLICVTENNIMFKPWIYDVKEWTDNSGVPASQREIGTDAFRKYVMKMVGMKKINNFNVKNFINKHKKK
jgi:hypothetical protein